MKGETIVCIRYLYVAVPIILIVASLQWLYAIEAQAQSGNLIFCIPSPGKVLDLNPYFYIASPPLTHGTILKFLYETLAEETSNGSLEPLLATNWTMSSDGKEIVIKLRENVLWHDGYRFTSADVAFVLYAIKRFPQGDVYSIGGYISTIETPDNYTVKIKLSQPFSRFLYYLLTGYRIFPEHVFKDKDMSNTTVTDMRELVGTGPFKVSEIDLAAQIMRLVAFDRYWGGKSNIGEIVIRVVDESAPLPAMLATGQCSIAMITNPALAAPLSTNPDIRIATAKGWPYQGSYYTPASLIILNTAIYPLNITAFREALAYAVDKERIIQLALQGFGEISSSGQLPISSRWRPGDLNELTFNITKAKEILTSLGFTLGSDGILRYPNGSPVSIKIIDTGGLASNIAPIIIQNWRSIGIDAYEETLTRLAYVNSLSLGYYQAAILLTNRPLDVDFILTVFMDRQDMPTPIGKPTQYWGWSRYVNSDFKSAIMKARQAVSEEEAFKYYAEAQRIAARDQWVIPIYYAKAIWAFNIKSFSGWDPLYAGEGFPTHRSMLSIKPYTQAQPQTQTMYIEKQATLTQRETITQEKTAGAMTQQIMPESIIIVSIVLAILVALLVAVIFLRRKYK